MADIELELVVKIDEEDYINIKNAINSLIEHGIARDSMSKVCLAILDGTPLPKGHGRLIDVKNLQNFVSRYTEYDAVQLILADREDYIPTIIEADKKSEG